MTPKTFETAVDKLDQIIQEMENGDLALETSLKKFENGINLVRFCSEKLNEADKKITLLMKDKDDNFSETLFAQYDK